MTIGFDLDGVVFNSEESIRMQAHLFDMLEIKGNGLIDSSTHDAKDRHNWNLEQYKLFSDKYLAELVGSAPLMAGAKQVMELLKKDGHKLISVTNRGYNEQELLGSEKSLKENNLPFDEVFYVKKSKVEMCINNKVDIFIDDNPRIIKELLTAGIDCIYYQGAGIENVNEVKTVHNWAQIYSFFRKN